MGDWCLGHGPLGMGSDINAAQRQVNSVSHGSMVLESVLRTLQGVHHSHKDLVKTGSCQFYHQLAHDH